MPALSGLVGRRLWWFRACVAVLLPLLVFGGLELGLRMFGYGYPTSFFLRTSIHGADYYVPNDEFGYRFFPRALARTPAAQRMAVHKPRDTFRVFVFGESAAMGDPDPSFGAWRYLQTLLRERFPGMRFEVICVAMTAINSHAILPIARECAGCNGDLWIVYMGNNEIVGPFGAGTVFGSQAPPVGLVRLELALKSSRTGQWLEHLMQQRGGGNAAPKTWEGLNMFKQHQVRFDDPGRLRADENFRRNLEDILRAGHSAGVPILLSTVGSNLKDCGPFGSLHRPGLNSAEAGEWDRWYQAGLGLEATGDYQGALGQFTRAAAVDPQYAELRFHMGRCEAALTNLDLAAREFDLARDYDTLAFRADSRINQIIKDAAQAHASQGVRLLDAARMFAQNSPGEIPGNEWFYEHVHLNFGASYLLGRAFAEQTVKLIPKLAAARGDNDWASPELCDRRLAVSWWDRCRVWHEVLDRVSRPPFTAQATHGALLDLCREMCGETEAKADAETREQTRQLFQEAVALAPTDTFLHWNYAQYLGSTGKLAPATEEAKQVCDLLPQFAGHYCDIAGMLIIQGKIDEASDYLSRALAIHGDFVNALNGMGLIRQNEQKDAEAAAYFKRALRADPAHVETLLNLAFLEQNRGNGRQAAIYYERAAGLQPDGPADYLSRAVGLSALGQRPQAIASFQTAVQSKPDFWQAHYLLGNELAAQGKISAARAQFFDAARYRPDFAKSHLGLAEMLLKLNQPDEARKELQITLQIDPDNQAAQQYLRAANASASPATSP